MLIKQKLRLIYQGEAFNGKPTKTARSHGKKFQVSVRQETSKLLVGTYHCNFNLPIAMNTLEHDVFFLVPISLVTISRLRQGNLHA